MSNNINYRDGDKQSSKYYDFGSSESDKLKADKEMYNSPKHNVTTDSLGLMVRKYDRSSKRTTLINDDVRVYKGGSWRDRAYWLDPAEGIFHKIWLLIILDLDVQCQEWVRNLTEGKHRGISFYKITIKALLLGAFNRF
jgi:hypothetical protein